MSQARVDLASPFYYGTRSLIWFTLLIMSLTLDELHRAQKLNRDAIVRLVQENYPIVHRVAHGLAGRRDVARGVLKFVLSRGLRMLPLWRDEGAPARWFLHHTILTARRAARRIPAPMEDLLVLESNSAEPAYVAFVRALRTIPIQQREAFLLHHAEHLQMRQVAIGMDCSVEAANTHLAAAQSALRNVAGNDYARYSQQVADAYAKLAPTEDIVLPTIRSRVSRYVWPRRIWRIVSPLFAIAIFAAILWGAWKLYHLIDI